jgi:hypothetical protein
MKSAKLLTALAIVGVATAPVAAQQAPIDRSASPVASSEKLRGAGLGWLIALAVALGVALVIISDDEDAPTSP